MYLLSGSVALALTGRVLVGLVRKIFQIWHIHQLVLAYLYIVLKSRKCSAYYTVMVTLLHSAVTNC